MKNQKCRNKFNKTNIKVKNQRIIKNKIKVFQKNVVYQILDRQISITLIHSKINNL